MATINIEAVDQYCIEHGYTVLNQYTRAKDPLYIECQQGHVTKTTLDTLRKRKDKGCHECRGYIRRINLDLFRTEVRKEGYELFETTVISAHQRVKAICPHNHEIYIDYANFKSGKRCPICYRASINKVAKQNITLGEFADSERLDYFQASEKLKTRGVYAIYCKPRGKLYIGSTMAKKGIQKRLRDHISMLNKDIHHSILLQRAWNKYGSEAFVFKIIEDCSNMTVKECLEREQYWIDFYQSSDPTRGFNIAPVTGSSLGIKRRPETIAKTRLANLGRVQSEEEKAKRALSNKGKVMSAEARKKISDAHKGKVVSAETRKKLSDYMKNKHKEKLAQIDSDGDVIVSRGY
jgi:group I intron endonuclease